MLGTIASLSDEGLRDAREHYATLLEARPKPHVLDDATIARLKRVNGESLEWCDVYDRQLARWRAGASGSHRRRAWRSYGCRACNVTCASAHASGRRAVSYAVRQFWT
jgi:hypothetical protein